MVSPDLGNKRRDQKLRDFAGQIVRATGKQRRRFEDYLYGSLLSAAQDLAGEHEQPSQTVMRANLRGVKAAHTPSKPTIQVQPEPSKPIIQIGSGYSVAAEKSTKVVSQDMPPKPAIQTGTQTRRGFSVAAEKSTEVTPQDVPSKPTIQSQSPSQTQTKSGISVGAEKSTKVDSGFSVAAEKTTKVDSE